MGLLTYDYPTIGGWYKFEPRIETELITAVASHCCENLKLAYFLSKFGSLLRHITRLKCVPHVELNDCFLCAINHAIACLFKVNQLEQICVNLCSETLQHFYNTHIFKSAGDFIR